MPSQRGGETDNLHLAVEAQQVMYHFSFCRVLEYRICKSARHRTDTASQANIWVDTMESMEMPTGRGIVLNVDIASLALEHCLPSEYDSSS